ncbi:MAG: nucleotidyltransferase domain-containing protein [Desulfosporosinus sp.]
MGQIYTTNEIREKLLPIFNTIPLEKAILFGSYAKGNPTSSSDIDIVIDSSGRIKGIDFFGVLEDMTEALGKPIDLIEASQIIRGGKLQRAIEETGVIIYERT